MGQLKLHPSQTNPDAAYKLARTLLRHKRSGKFPYDLPEPGMVIARGLERLGQGSLGREGTARLLFGHTLADIAVDSFTLARRAITSLDDYFHLYLPDSFDDGVVDKVRYIGHSGDEEIAEILRNGTGETAEDLVRMLRDGLRHPRWTTLSHFWASSFLEVARNWNGSVVDLLNGSKSAQEVYSLLTSTREVNGERRKRFPGLGDKVARMLIIRSAKSGICHPSDLATIGIPVDVHALVLSAGNGVISLPGSERASTAVRALHALWSEVVTEHNLDPTELYEAIWLWGRRMCRSIRCKSCPLAGKGGCIGRISTGGYYNNEGPKVVTTSYVIEPQDELPFEMYTPELLEEDDKTAEEAVVEAWLLGGDQPRLPWMTEQ